MKGSRIGTVDTIPVASPEIVVDSPQIEVDYSRIKVDCLKTGHSSKKFFPLLIHQDTCTPYIPLFFVHLPLSVHTDLRRQLCSPSFLYSRLILISCIPQWVFLTCILDLRRLEQLLYYLVVGKTECVYSIVSFAVGMPIALHFFFLAFRTCFSYNKRVYV